MADVNLKCAITYIYTKHNHVHLKTTMKKLTIEDRVTYLRIALQMQNIGIDDCATEGVIRTYELIQKRRGRVTLREVAKIHSETIEKYKQNETTTTTLERA